MRSLAVVFALAVALSACSSDGSAPSTTISTSATDTAPVVPAADFTEGLTVVASSPGALGVGTQRVLMVVATQESELLGGPDDPATVTFALDGEEFADNPTEWVWGIEGVRGFYVATFDFPRPGNWEATLTNAAGSAQTSPFTVSEQVLVPEVGTPAPASDSRTSADAPLEQITTDPEPEPTFYELSIADAVTSGRPSVIVFATPAVCTTAICGPTMEVMKSVATDFSEANFVHVEVYENIDDPQGQLIEVDAVTEWGLPTEPWVFVIDAEGTVAARFEGTVGANELARALEALQS
jgi:hypothetical protein